MGTPQDPRARAKQKARRRRKEARLQEKKAATQVAQTEEKKLPEPASGRQSGGRGQSRRKATSWSLR